MTPIALCALHLHPVIMFQTHITLHQALSHSEDMIHESIDRTLSMVGEEGRGKSRTLLHPQTSTFSRCRSLCHSRVASQHATTTGPIALASIRCRVRCRSAWQARLCSQVKEGSLGVGTTKVESKKQQICCEWKTAERSHSKHENRTPLCWLILARTPQKGKTWERSINLPTAFGLRSEL
jgi:hypothetical protein